MKLLAWSSLLMVDLLLGAFFATTAKALGRQDQKSDGRGSIGIKDLVRRRNNCKTAISSKTSFLPAHAAYR
jgi:hypothetical protein